MHWTFFISFSIFCTSQLPVPISSGFSWSELSSSTRNSSLSRTELSISNVCLRIAMSWCSISPLLLAIPVFRRCFIPSDFSSSWSILNLDLIFLPIYWHHLHDSWLALHHYDLRGPWFRQIASNFPKYLDMSIQRLMHYCSEFSNE